MDPLTALSVARTIVQFADFGTKLFSEGYEMYKATTGALTANDQLALITVDLRVLIEKLQQFHWEFVGESVAKSPSADEQYHHEIVEKICGDAVELADHILNRVDGLKVNGKKHRKWNSFTQAIKSLWSREEIAGLVKRLSNLKDALLTRVIYSIWSNLRAQSISNSSTFDRLDQQTQHIITKLLESTNQVEETQGELKEFRNQLAFLANYLARIEAANVDEHRQTRDAILNCERTYRGQKLDHVISKLQMLSATQADEAKLRKSVNAILLGSLHYPTMTSRYEAVLEAYPQTFEWAFQTSGNGQATWTNLSEWLKSGNGLYWIQGKAGSGKSTLMKHLFEDPRTRSYLENWAHDSASDGTEPTTLCVASFFFWNSGSLEQKSQTGLLRRLLHQILLAIPDLIPITFPEQYAQIYSKQAHNELYPTISWSRSELTRGFGSITKQKLISCKLCLIVDGLDEFDGDHEDMAKLFKMAALSPTVKICVSSRPWQVFKDSFHNRPNLQLQDLTYNDIRKYVSSKFDQSAAFERLAEEDSSSAHLLVQEIVDKAAGVFLWVAIVVKSLIQGINNRDNVSILQQRLWRFPSELKPLYDHIFNNHIDDLYKPWASRAFQILRASRAVFAHDAPSSTENHLTLLDLMYSMEDELDVQSFRPLDKKSLTQKCHSVAIQLNTRCAGLLEVRQEPEIYSRVEYMHRTVRDFLEKEECWAQLLSYTARTMFNSYLCLFRNCVLYIKYRHQINSSQRLVGRASTAMLFAYYADLHLETHEAQIALLDDLDRLTVKQRKVRTREIAMNESFLHQALRYCLTGYIQDKLDKLEPNAAKVRASSLLKLLPTRRYLIGTNEIAVTGADWPKGIPVFRPMIRPGSSRVYDMTAIDAEWNRELPPFREDVRVLLLSYATKETGGCLLPKQQSPAWLEVECDTSDSDTSYS
ncbi:uncharacterized protein LY89DRAFT_692455 [Mollisia scopiformis]|uniref:Uncharacterized protein n=1 Tax=Mollisia scopiformis TaxID=149040 RepID=A0A132B253_MOLSC|nr:uncharacterized protein LY89DRAFT_692455 [Mollisia scopiformis]KUJ06478.1 hypothetical protein LY89DRAFT_692455 [Mollisia scopiformis]